jgi:hypothetical protein
MTIPQQHTRRAWNQGITKNNHTGYCTHTLECTKLKVQNIFNMQNNITCSYNTIYPRSMVCFRYIILNTLYKGNDDDDDDDDYDNNNNRFFFILDFKITEYIYI